MPETPNIDNAITIIDSVATPDNGLRIRQLRQSAQLSDYGSTTFLNVPVVPVWLPV
jgi:hypothetical protein